MQAPRTVVVVGGGCSGTLAAVHLLRAAQRPARVVLVERRAEVGQGVAYGTTDPLHLLNVPAGKMSAWPDAPGDFLDWLRQGPVPDAEAGTFVPRLHFGAYLADTLFAALADASPGVVLDVVPGEAVDVRETPDGVAVHLADGRVRHADRGVLAVGHGPSVYPAGDDVRARVVADPWTPGAMDRIAPTDAVLFVGTGLTMVDHVLGLAARGHTGPMTAVSRRGLVPRRHAPSPPADPALDALPPLRRLRAAGDAWRDALDRMRALTPTLWQALTVAEQRRYLRHLRPYWDVHRHRLPPPSADAFDALRRAGQVVVEAGRVVTLQPDGDAVDVYLLPRRRETPALRRVHWVVNCTGTSLACTEADHPVLAGALGRGDVRRHPLGLGLDVTPDGAVVRADGMASRRLYTLGPLRVGRLWETTAVPEIRAQAQALAARLLPSVPVSA